MLEQAFVPARRTLGTRWIITAILSSPRITKSHGKNCDLSFIEEGRTIQPQPVTQAIAACIIPRYTTPMDLAPRRLTDDQQPSGARQLHHGTGTEWQFRLADATGPHFAQQTFQRAHRPPERTDVLWVHIRAIGEIVKCRFQIAYRALLPKTALEFASFRGIGRDFASVEIHGKRDVPFCCQFHSLFLHPLVQTPPFMNDNYRSMAPRTIRQGQKSCNFLGSARECHHPRFRSIWLTRCGRR